MIKRRTTRPQPRTRERDLSPDPATNNTPENEQDDESNLPLAELIELRKLKKQRQGIDVNKLSKGDVKKKKKKQTEDDEDELHEKGGLRAGAKADEEDEEEDTIAKARRAVRTNNFTQQTNALDVDKHMHANHCLNRMAYIEENLKIRSKPSDSPDPSVKPNSQDEFSLISERWKNDNPGKPADEGSVTNSLAMLTAIPEVDLGMDTRLKNIEETEKAKRMVAEERKERQKPNRDEEHLVASRFYRPHLKQKSDAEIMRDAKLEALGLPVPSEERGKRRQGHERPQMATDEVVMERFKKRMRR
ncbi:hepatocellular carcinoma-associated antigen 59-domain-containing protein [Hygrophoropsis aurantiaca]|uniref:Hepatocellular carcinoma-associated antigen 59-domain-containing protein n=1 Tax=Hygrophoropsis aurantiaca TaxID=72124 RepID=A0ACB8A0W7_9AGAM|nr:hepatocellular carcinoma-associated antigen 59-domain-containing protein [Hygrophoropsis aurantiaca]